jgi:RHS repeat-associated protein
VFTLPQGDYRFRADKDGGQYWSGESNHCAVPGCTVVTVTVGSQALLLPGSQRRPAGLAALTPVRSPAPATQSGEPITVTRAITYTYDPLNRLTGAYYSTGESFEYAYSAVGNRTAMTATQGVAGATVTTYTYDSANRLTSVDGVTYTWDARGNLTNDGVFTYTYNSAGRMVRAESVTLTLLYTYTAGGLRVAQSVGVEQSVFVWDWANPTTSGGVPELLLHSPSSHSPSSYLVGHETLGQWDGATWTYYLPDAGCGLPQHGSIRQTVNGAGAVVSAREWDPYGVEVGAAQGAPQAGPGYTGEWFDGDAGLVYLRARWYDSEVGRFTQRDVWRGNTRQPLTMNPYLYALANPVRFSDPSGYQSESEKFYIRLLYNWYIESTAERLNVRSLTNMSNDAFATMIAAKILVEDATIYADRQPAGVLRELATMPVTILRPWLRDLLEREVFGGEISWGPANLPLPFVMQNLEWWEIAYSALGLNSEDVHTYYYDARERGWFLRWLVGNEENQLVFELQTGEGTANQMALAILRTSWRIKEYYQRRHLASGGCEPIPDLSAYMIAMGIRNYQYPDDFIFELDNWETQGMPWDWVEAMGGTAEALGFSLIRGDQVASGTCYDYLPYTVEEKEKLESIPHE